MNVKRQVILFLTVVFSVFVGVFSSYAGSISGEVREWTREHARIYNTMQRNDQGGFATAQPGMSNLSALENHPVYLLDSTGTVIIRSL